MMPKSLPDVINDSGYQKEARDFAHNMMDCRGILFPCKNFNEFPEWMNNALQKAYLYGAQSAVRVGYLLKDKAYEETLKMYKQQIDDLKKGNSIENLKISNNVNTWHECTDAPDGVPQLNTPCLLRIEYKEICTDITEVDYLTAVWGDYGWSEDYLDNFDESEFKIKITHWKPIIKPKGVEQ